MHGVHGDLAEFVEGEPILVLGSSTLQIIGETFDRFESTFG